jgi:two-component system OmpR family sensor kinase
MSLRVRLTAIVVLVAALSLIATSVLVRNYIARSLNATLDQRADTILAAPLQINVPGNFPSNGPPSGARPVADSGLFVQARDGDGAVVRELFDNSNDSSLSKPQLDDVRIDTTSSVVRRFETPSVAGSNPANYRVSVETKTTATGTTTLLVAIPTSDRDSTLSRLVRIEAVATLAGLLIATMGSLILVGAGLRPLRRIEDAAAVIAEGDLSHRVQDDDGPTETIRLGRALNSMMAQIEHAFAAKEASQQQLRQFVADASHELRTPLTSIRGHAELTRRGLNEDDLARASWRPTRRRPVAARPLRRRAAARTH